MQIGKLIGAGKEAEVFEYGERVLKLYKARAGKDPAFREAANLAIAETRGLPSPAAYDVRLFGDRWGIVMDRVTGHPFAEAMLADPALGPAHLGDMVRLHVTIHSARGAHLSSMRTRLAFNIGRAQILGEARQQRLLELLHALPEGDRLCHGDFHPFNILGVPGAAIVVDWLDATCGAPAADVCRSYVLLRAFAPAVADAYVAAYVQATGMARESVNVWLPVTAGARVAENVPAEFDALVAMADMA
jgi:aminoglycoside phosphotransferase (APT) family kinase protein